MNLMRNPRGEFCVLCPYCGGEAPLVSGLVIYPHRPDLAGKKFYRCAPCDAYVGCHPPARVKGGGLGEGNVPLGRLANAELRRAKQAAHAAFDPLWRDGGLKRAEAYGWLSEQLGIPFRDCHIGMFDVEQCRAVIVAAKQRTTSPSI